jgi:prepilin-type N-terminal cleavage/methylation domain-containing protein
MNPGKLRGSDGMSMLEVLIGMLIFAIGVLGLTGMFVVAIDANQVSRHYETASKLALEKLEEYQGLENFEGLDSTMVLPFVQTEDSLQERYRRVTQVYDNATDPLIPAGMCKVSVEVLWVDHQNQQHGTRYSTLMTKQ